MALEYETSANGGTVQYNGNISTIQWNTNINGTCSTRNLYRFSYDYANRLTGATYRARVGTSWVDQSKYTEGSITYDLNGNIKTYLRRGHTTGSMIDNLTYTYGDAARPDRLTNVVDAADSAKGFKYTAGAADYQYDLNWNLTQDNHKQFTYGYNYLNLPQSMTKGTDVITMTYTADGEKLTKALTGGGATKSYVSGIEYSGTNLEAIYFSEGRCTPNGASAFYYEYTVKDHLGNARVSFQANGASLTTLQENHYYPFGLEMEGSWITQVGTENLYQYNGKELNEDFGLNLHDYKKRWYDPALSRFLEIDPKASMYFPWSPYNYVLGNPILNIDPEGDTVKVSYKGQDLIYNSGKYYNSDGSEYTGKGLKKDGTYKGFLGQVAKALSQISASSEGQNVIGELVGSTNVFTIKFGTDNGFSPEKVVKAGANIPEWQVATGNTKGSTGSGGIIEWNPYSSTGGLNTSGDNSRPSFIALAHEMFHGRDANNGVLHFKGDLADGAGVTTYDSKHLGLLKAEWRAVYYENVLRGQLGEKLRTHYGYEETAPGVYKPTGPALLDGSGNPINYPIR